MVFWIIPFAFILLNGNNDFGPISRWLNHHGCAVWATLGKLSIYIYLLHFQVVMIGRQLTLPEHSISEQLTDPCSGFGFCRAGNDCHGIHPQAPLTSCETTRCNRMSFRRSFILTLILRGIIIVENDQG